MVSPGRHYCHYRSVDSIYICESAHWSTRAAHRRVFRRLWQSRSRSNTEIRHSGGASALGHSVRGPSWSTIPGRSRPSSPATRAAGESGPPARRGRAGRPALASNPDAVTRLSLAHTRRLGPQTTAVIQPAFYADLAFDPASGKRRRLAGPGDPVFAAAAATSGSCSMGASWSTTTETAVRWPLTMWRSSTPHVEQASAIAARPTYAAC